MREAGLVAVLATVVLTALLLFYGRFYSIHQDLAGSALSGKLAVTLGSAFDRYAVYFPPAERWWFSLAARFADLTGVRLDLVVVGMTGLAVLFSGALAYSVRRRAVGATPLFLIGSTAILVVVPILFKNVFGLREHMVVLGLWPYLVLRLSDPDGTRIGLPLRLVIGLWLGATLLFKYLYCAVVLLVELADAIMQRCPRLLFRAENLVAGAVVAIYLLLWLGIDPSQRAAIGAMMSAIDANLVSTRVALLHAASNFLLAVFLLLVARLLSIAPRKSAIGLALVTGAMVAAWGQGRWYSHHIFPIVMAYVGWWWIAGRQFRWWTHAMVAASLLFSIGGEFAKSARYQSSVRELEASLQQAGQSVTGKKVGLLTMHPSPYNEYLAAHGAARWNSMMNIAYVGAELKPFDVPEREGALPPPVNLTDPGRRALHTEMLRLWEDQPPDVLILDHSTSWPLRHLDVEWTHVFSRDPRFNAILRNYRPVFRHAGERTRFTYYVRAN